MTDDAFRDFIWDQGRRLYRDMPWRQRTDPYAILVSELMLQQTQVERVRPKFLDFMQAFPTLDDLAASPLEDVVQLWSGLGYNRRAKFLRDSARTVVQNLKGVFPAALDQLRALPGVGPNTAAAIRVYAYNQPEPFVETNVRTVFFHHFFSDHDHVTDVDVRDKVQATLDQEHPREWFWALMDYGFYLKSQGVRNTSKSASYVKQAPLAGSVREVRGKILKYVGERRRTLSWLEASFQSDSRLMPALDGLIRDGLIERDGNDFRLTK